jgi:hypothetical protein
LQRFCKGKVRIIMLFIEIHSCKESIRRSGRNRCKVIEGVLSREGSQLFFNGKRQEGGWFMLLYEG